MDASCAQASDILTLYQASIISEKWTFIFILFAILNFYDVRMTNIKG